MHKQRQSQYQRQRCRRRHHHQRPKAEAVAEATASLFCVLCCVLFISASSLSLSLVAVRSLSVCSFRSVRSFVRSCKSPIDVNEFAASENSPTIIRQSCIDRPSSPSIKAIHFFSEPLFFNTHSLQPLKRVGIWNRRPPTAKEKTPPEVTSTRQPQQQQQQRIHCPSRLKIVRRQKTDFNEPSVSVPSSALPRLQAAKLYPRQRELGAQTCGQHSSISARQQQQQQQQPLGALNFRSIYCRQSTTVTPAIIITIGVSRVCIATHSTVSRLASYCFERSAKLLKIHPGLAVRR